MRVATTAWILLGCLGFGPTARAGVIANDRFETGTLLRSDSPPGAWDRVTQLAAPNSIQAAPDAAMSGQRGLRMVDQDASTTISGQGAVQVDLPFVTADVFARTWFRLTSSNGTGMPSVLYVQDISPSLLADVRITASDGTLTIDTGPVDIVATDVTVNTGKWTLLELYLQGIGSPVATLSAFVDGRHIGTRSVPDWSGRQASWVMIGEPWDYAGGFTGTLDFDHFVLATEPLASRLVLQALEGGRGRCQPIRVSLSDSRGQVATAWEELEVEVGSFTGVFYADDRCTTESSRAPIAPGASSAVRYLLHPGSTGTVEVWARHADFVEAMLLADAVKADPLPLTVGCGCHASGDAFLLAPAFLLALARRGNRKSRVRRTCNNSA